MSFAIGGTLSRLSLRLLVRYAETMESPRLPRFKRASAVAPIELTHRDHYILRLVHRHRFLRSSHLIALLEGSPQSLLRRLQLLYHHGYLERPRAQLQYYERGGSKPIVYGLGSKGGKLLKEELGSAYRPLRWGEKNRSIGRMFLEHALLVSDVLVALELACRKAGNIQLLLEDDLLLSKPCRWNVNLEGNIRLGVIPDRVFALESDHERAYFFLEADRGTMPVVRKRLTQTSFHRKMLAYEATWTQDKHLSEFGFHRFRVLAVTKSQSRVQSLIKACFSLRRGQGLFLFAHHSVLEQPDLLSAPVWRNGRGELTSLLP